MMNFRTIKESLICNVLGPYENDRFQTIGFQRQTTNADEVLDCNRFVQIYYESGKFPKSSGRLNGPTQHNITFRIDMTVSKQAEGDLSVINNSSSSASEIATALAEFQEASSLADDSMDELYDIVYQIIMDARHIDLGLDKGIVSNRWISEMVKGQPIPRGESVVLTGSMFLTCNTVEIVDGDTGFEGTENDITIGIDGDDVQKTGVFVEKT